MTFMIQTEVKCATCGNSRSYYNGIKMEHCPFCGGQALHRVQVNNHDLILDYLLPMRVDKDTADATFKSSLSGFAKQHGITLKKLPMLRTAFYLPIWVFDFSVDPDGSGHKKPIHSLRTRLALELQPASIFEGVRLPDGDFPPFDETHIDNTPLWMPQIPYHQAQSELIKRARDAGIVGEVGVVTHLLLYPVWLLTIVEKRRLSHLYVDGITGKLHTSPPRQRPT